MPTPARAFIPDFRDFFIVIVQKKQMAFDLPMQDADQKQF